MPAAFVLGGLFLAGVVSFWRCFARLNRRIDQALDEPCELERSTRQLYEEPDGLARRLLEEAKPR